jgi:hypothetical protein
VVGAELVAQPRGQDPHPPQGQEEHQGVEGSPEIEVLDQLIGELGEREDIDQVEEQFEKRRFSRRVRAA